ncbi:integrin alpha-X-like isoform X2 [Montipora capricornis]|uniref:integrin alpha-X-like isoform X2 n=1 Tax=Montipora capricornis TaxID=246305 RepID=UPI0035F142FE
MSARSGLRFYALFSMFVLLSVCMMQNPANGNPSKEKTARRLAKKLPFLSKQGKIMGDVFGPAFVHNTVDDTYDVVFIIDVSGSIPSNEFHKGVSAVRYLIEKADPSSKFAVIKFSNQATLLFNFISPDKAKTKLMNVAHTGGATNTQHALRMARRDLFQNPSASGHRQLASKLAVVITDGFSNIQRDQTVPQATLLKGIGTEVLVIAVGNFGAAGLKEICDIASQPCNETVFNLDNYINVLEIAKMAAKQGK